MPTCALSTPVFDFTLETILSPISKAEYCGNTTCEASLASDIEAKWYVAAGSSIGLNYTSDLLQCVCDAGNGISDADAFISIGGQLVPTGAVGVNKLCLSPLCRESVLNADFVNSGGSIYDLCYLSSGIDCDAPGAGGAYAIRDKLTQCMCEAAASDYHYFWGKEITESGDNTWRTFCAFNACSELIDMTWAAGLTTHETCTQATSGDLNPLVFVVIGVGVLGAIGAIVGMVWQAKRAKRRSSPGRPAPTSQVKFTDASTVSQA